MPTYEFLCEKCLTCSIAEYERKKKEGIKCSECGSLEVEQQISGFGVQTSKKS